MSVKIKIPRGNKEITKDNIPIEELASIVLSPKKLEKAIKATKSLKLK